MRTEASQEGVSEARRKAELREDYEAQLAVLLNRQDQLRQEHVRFIDERNDWVSAQMQADPRYEPLDLSLSARLRALEVVYFSSFLNIVMGFGLKFLIITLDL